MKAPKPLKDLAGFGRWLKEKPRGTRAKAAKSIGVHRAQLSLWLSGLRRPRPEQVIGLLRFAQEWTQQETLTVHVQFEGADVNLLKTAASAQGLEVREFVRTAALRCAKRPPGKSGS